MDNDLKELLHDKAEEMRLDPEIPPQVLRRARRRRLRTGAMAGGTVVVIAFGTFIGVKAAMNQNALLPVNSPTLPSVVSPPPSQRWPFANGLIAFIRIDRKTVGEGKIPEADLYTMNADGTGIARLAATNSASTPAWSPDGTRIAFSGTRGGTPGILLVNADGSGLSRVTRCDFREGCDGEGSPAWSPDGRQLAFWSDRDGREGLWTVHADGSSLTLLTEGLSFGPPAWSPDGRVIAVNGNTVDAPSRRGILFVDVQTRNVIRRIFPEGLSPSFGVTWSPDGDWIAFDSEGKDGGREGSGLFIMRADGADLRLLSSCPSESCRALAPAWSPDGRFVAFTEGSNEADPSGLSGDLFLLEVETGRLQQLTEGPSPDCCPSWQPVNPDSIGG